METEETIPRTTVIIPTLNGAKSLPDFFSALNKQTYRPDEVLVCDSSSDDNSVEICESFGATVFKISRDEFDHGGTRTKLSKMAKGEVVIFFTQDAVLKSVDGLEKIIAPLLNNDDVACSYGRQLPLKNATPIAAHLRLFNYPAESCVRSFNDRLKYGLKTIFMSNSFAAYKKEVLGSVDFFKNGLIFGEDTCTLGRILQAGFEVAYVGDSEVFHSHNYSLKEEFKRSFDIGVLHTSEQWLLDVYGKAEGVGKHYFFSLIKSLIDSRSYTYIPDAFIRTTYKFIGYKLGRAFWKLPVGLRPKLSMHHTWWSRKKTEGK